MNLKYKGISKFPIVRRDLSIVVDEEIPLADLLQSINAIELDLGPHLSEAELAVARESRIT